MVDECPPGTMTDVRSPAATAPGSVLPIGAMLGGRYRITRFLAAGGMGEVYQADDCLLGDPVAIKLLLAEALRRPGAQARFAEEIRLARTVTHPNVCRVFDVGAEGERIFYTMELHEGLTLKHHLAHHGPLELSVARPIVAQLLAGIGAAHAVSVVHADLKPSNILLGPDGRVVVTDFGLALPCCAPDARHLVGTPAYMAPEQVTGGMVVDGTDLFSFGVTLFEILTGRLPWQGRTTLELATARLHGPRPSVRTLCPQLDPRWDDVIRCCLEVDRAARPESAAAVMRALELA